MQEYIVKVYEGHTEWRQNGKLHREDRPAIEWADGSKSWYLNGKPHREDGPAIEYADGYKSWYKNGQRHREDGPAIEWSDGSKFWYLNGVELNEQEFNARMKPKSSLDFFYTEDVKKFITYYANFIDTLVKEEIKKLDSIEAKRSNISFTRIQTQLGCLQNIHTHLLFELERANKDIQKAE